MEPSLLEPERAKVAIWPVRSNLVSVEVNTIPLLAVIVWLGSLACHPPASLEFSSGMQPQQATWEFPFSSLGFRV